MKAKCPMTRTKMKLNLVMPFVLLWLSVCFQFANFQELGTKELKTKDHDIEDGVIRSDVTNEDDEGANENLIKNLQGMPTDKLKSLLRIINKQNNRNEDGDSNSSSDEDEINQSKLLQEHNKETTESKDLRRKVSFHRLIKPKEGLDNFAKSEDMGEQEGEKTGDEMKTSQQKTKTGNLRQLKRLEPVTNVLIHAFEGNTNDEREEDETGRGTSHNENILQLNSKQANMKENDGGVDVFADAEEKPLIKQGRHQSPNSADLRMKLTQLLPKPPKVESGNGSPDQTETSPGDLPKAQSGKIYGSLSTKQNLQMQEENDNQRQNRDSNNDLTAQPSHSHDDVTTFVSPIDMKPIRGKQNNPAIIHKVIKESLPANIIQEINDAMIERVRESGDRRASLGIKEGDREGSAKSRESMDVTSTADQNSSETDANKRVGSGNKSQFAFSYDPDSPIGPEMWKVLHTDWTCQGRKQSPINIKTEDVANDTLCKNIAIRVEPEGRPLTGILRNNGHAPTFSLTSNTAVRLFGGTLPGDFYLKQLHFHFGCENSRGSEHKVDGQAFPMELHLVFWDKKTFDSFAQAAKSDRGIAVVAIMFQRSFVPVSQIRNTPVTQLLQVLKKIPNEGDFVQISEIFDFRLEKLIPNVMNMLQADRFFTYEGSLTTPGCYESVIWIVLNSHPVITDDQLEMFRKLKSSKVNGDGTMCDNYRPIQKSYGRRIFSNIV